MKESDNKKRSTISLGINVDLEKVIKSKGSDRVEYKSRVKTQKSSPIVKKEKLPKENKIHYANKKEENLLSKRERASRFDALKNFQSEDTKVIKKVSTANIIDKTKDIPVIEEITPVISKKSMPKASPIISKKEVAEKPYEEEKPPVKKIFKKDKKIKDWKNLVNLDVAEETVSDNVSASYRENHFKIQTKIKRKNKKAQVTREKLYRTIQWEDSISAAKFAHQLSEKIQTVIKIAKSLGIEVDKNTLIDYDSAVLIAEDLGHAVEIKQQASLEEIYSLDNVDEKNLLKRPPVITIMGHVDHGKTTLLDYIRKSKVAEKEQGGITQHVGAYQVQPRDGEVITFLDTPGHEAFAEIRSRGANVTDIVLLVVAADDGVRPQTVEAIQHAKAAGVAIILVINKIDKPDTNVMKLKTDLLQHDLVVEEMGGDILSVEVSAISGQGIDTLMDTILLQAEILDLKTNYDTLAKGRVIEVKTKKGIGVVASVLLQVGTLSRGDFFVSGEVVGKVKTMVDCYGAIIKKAGPSTPVEISGFNEMVVAGDDFTVVKNEKEANAIRKERVDAKLKESTSNEDALLQDIFSAKPPILDNKKLYVVIKTDTQGSLEAIKSSLAKMEHDEVEVKILISGVGEINENDLMLLNSEGGGCVFGFNIRANNKARDLAKKNGIDIRYHSVIYSLLDDIKMMLSGLLDPTIVEQILGYAEVRQVFNLTKIGKISGCYVTEGKIVKSENVRVLRDNIVIHSGKIDQLKRFKDDAKEVRSNFECGVSIVNYLDIQEGDKIECFTEKKEERTIE